MPRMLCAEADDDYTIVFEVCTSIEELILPFANTSTENVNKEIVLPYGETKKIRVYVKEPKGKLAIIRQPESVTVTAGQKAVFTFKAQGEGMKYTWYYKLPSSKTYKKYADNMTDEFSMSTSKSKNGTMVYCIVTDINGKKIKSDTVRLTVS